MTEAAVLRDYESRMAEARATWDQGPWTDEPDRVEWRHAGFPCLIVRSTGGNLCGYVGLPPGHPLYGKPYHDADVCVHGGLTYGDRCQGSICHVPQPGEPDAVFWLGFDCAHHLDIRPGTAAMNRKYRWSDLTELGAVYRDIAYVRSETESLARQLAAVASDREET